MMSQLGDEAQTDERFPPTWLQRVATIGICIHFAAVIATVLAAPSGPWPGGENAHPPVFAELSASMLEPWLSALKLSSTFHFSESRPTISTRFEAILRDSNGKEIASLKFPDPNASATVQHKQLLLAQELSQDEPLRAPQGYLVPAPGKESKTVPVWIVAEGARDGKLGTIAENLIPRDRPTFGPSPLALMAERSYARHLCRQFGAATCEITRFDRLLYPPMVLTESNDPNPANFEESSRSFGVTHAESPAK